MILFGSLGGNPQIKEIAKNVVLQKIEEKNKLEKSGNSVKVQKLEKPEKPEKVKKVNKSNKLKKPAISKSKKSTKKTSEKNVGSQKRFVSAVKVFLTDAEKAEILARVGNFGSLSNYIRHHLGLSPNAVGRKRLYTKSALDLELELELDDFEEIRSFGEIKSVENPEKIENIETKENSEKNEKSAEAVSGAHQAEIHITGGQISLWDNPNL